MLTVPYPFARVFATVLTAGIWWLILFVSTLIFAGAGRDTVVSTTSMLNITALSFFFVPFFTTQGVFVGMLDGLLQKRFTVLSESQPAARPQNPWRLAVRNALGIGVAGAAIGCVLVSRAGGSLAPTGFALRLASFGALLSALTAWQTAGAPFLHETRVAPEHRRMPGDARRYRWLRHAGPHGLVNAIINFAVAYAIFPVPLRPGALAPVKIVVGDTVITLLLLTVLIATGARTHARVDRQWGIAQAPEQPLDMAGAVLTPFFLGLLLSAAVFVVFAVTGSRGLDVESWAVYRAIVFGAYPAWLAYRVAGCELPGTSAS